MMRQGHERQTPTTRAGVAGVEKTAISKAVCNQDGSTFNAEKIGRTFCFVLMFALVDMVPLVLISMGCIAVLDAVITAMGVRT